jgi:predicted RNA binding protein YcfA (HicA-like mRNA interferase family)
LRLPRDLPGAELANLLRRYGYEISRQTGSHIRLTTTVMGAEHHVTIPAHKNLKLGTLASIVTEVAVYLKKERENLTDELFS